LGTGNKTELLLGYFTKHGDGGADILPIGGLYKTQVRQLAKTMGVPEKIIDKIPSAGQWEGQTDEGEIGLPYKKIDETLSLLYDVVMPEEAVALECDLPSNKVSALAARVARNRHKTRTPPIADLSEITG
jgi:NAD+ synthase